jgi:hypothetical protein
MLADTDDYRPITDTGSDRNSQTQLANTGANTQDTDLNMNSVYCQPKKKRIIPRSTFRFTMTLWHSGYVWPLSHTIILHQQISHN